MSANNQVLKEKKRKLSDVEESSGNNSKKKNMDIKPNIDIICKNIKKEPDFMVREIKKEPDFVVREIKRELDFVVREIKREPDFVVREIKNEPCQSDVEYVGPQLTEPTPKSKRKKQKTKANKTKRKASAKAKKRTSKKHKRSTQAKKTRNCKSNVISKKSKRCTVKTKKKRKKKSKSASKNPKRIKKEANTLLDQQGSGDLHLFGFKDELEYFSSESDHKEFEKTNSEKNIIGKRTSLSSLDARDKVIHTLKSAPKHPPSNPKPLIQQPKSENVDLLGSILENQALWHSKTSHMKVNEDGSVEVIERKNKKCAEIESTNDKEKNLLRNKTNSIVSIQTRNGHLESLNLSENIGTHSTKTNIKVEACDTMETWDTERVIDENKEQIWEKKVKIEEKKEKKEKNSFSPITRSIFANSPKIEISEDEEDDCPIFSIYSKASKMFSLQRDEERQMRYLSDKSEIQIIEIKEIEKIERNKKPSKRHKNYEKEEKHRELDTAKKRGRSPLPKRKKEENKQRKNIALITLE